MNTTFDNVDMQYYRDLTREQKHILLDAAIDGKCERYISHQSVDNYGGCFAHLEIYRVKPQAHKKLSIPWDVVDDKWEYAALDGDGDNEIYFYNSKPFCEIDGYWRSEKESCQCALKIDTEGVIPEHSLTKRGE